MDPSQDTQQRAWDQAFLLWTNAKKSSIASNDLTKPVIPRASGRKVVPVVDARSKVEPLVKSIKVNEVARKTRIKAEERLLYDPYTAVNFDPLSDTGGGYSDPTISMQPFSLYSAPNDLPSDISMQGFTSIGTAGVSTDPFGSVASQLYQDGTIVVNDVHEVTSAVVGVQNAITGAAGTLAADVVYELGGNAEAQAMASTVGSFVANTALGYAVDATGCVGCLDAVDAVNTATGGDPTQAVIGEFSCRFIPDPS